MSTPGTGSLLADERLSKPSISGRQRTQVELRSSRAFASRLDRVQVLGALETEDGVRAQSRPGRSIAQTYGHTGCINALAWSPDGRRLASGSDDTKVCLWKMGGEGSSGPTDSGDHSGPASADRPESAPRLDFSLGEVIHTGHTRNIFSVKWSPVSDQRLLSAAGDGEVRVFDLDRAAGKGRQVRRGRHSWHEWPDGDGPLFKTLRCHTDRVKRIATDGSNDIFLTAGEDGHVFQHDLRVPHTCRADGQGCGPPLVDYPGMSLFTLTISRAAPWMFVVGGTSPFVYLHDRRMMPLATLRDWGVPHRPGQLSQCVRRFGLPPVPEEASVEEERPRRRRLRRDRAHVTAAKLSDWHPRDLLVSYSGDDVYLFDIYGDPPVSTAVQGESSAARPKRRISAVQSGASDPRDRKRASSHEGKAQISADAAAAEGEEDSSESADGETAYSPPTSQKETPLPVGETVEEGAAGESEDESGELEDDTDDEFLVLPPRGPRPDPHSDVPILQPTRSFGGHVNTQTVKDVNFAGGNDNMVVSGSDDGNFFVWDKATGKVVNILEGDSQVVNVLQPHPSLPVLAISGIDDTAKIFAPVTRAPADRLASRLGQADEIVSRNRARRGARGDGFGVALPRHILMALLAQHGHAGEEGECAIQ